MFRHPMRPLGLIIVGCGLIVACFLGLATALLHCDEYPMATRTHLPPILVPPKRVGETESRIAFPEPIMEEEQWHADQITVETYLSVDQILTFYQQHLVAEGWESDYNINQQTKQMFIMNKQACPYYSLGITVKPTGRASTTVSIDPYLKDKCDCN